MALARGFCRENTFFRGTRRQNSGCFRSERKRKPRATRAEATAEDVIIGKEIMTCLGGEFRPFGKYRLAWPLKMVRIFLRG